MLKQNYMRAEIASKGGEKEVEKTLKEILAELRKIRKSLESRTVKTELCLDGHKIATHQADELASAMSKAIREAIRDTYAKSP